MGRDVTPPATQLFKSLAVSALGLAPFSLVSSVLMADSVLWWRWKT